MLMTLLYKTYQNHQSGPRSQPPSPQALEFNNAPTTDAELEDIYNQVITGFLDKVYSEAIRLKWEQESHAASQSTSHLPSPSSSSVGHRVPRSLLVPPSSSSPSDSRPLLGRTSLTQSNVSRSPPSVRSQLSGSSIRSSISRSLRGIQDTTRSIQGDDPMNRSKTVPTRRPATRKNRVKFSEPQSASGDGSFHASQFYSHAVQAHISPGLKNPLHSQTESSISSESTWDTQRPDTPSSMTQEDAFNNPSPSEVTKTEQLSIDSTPEPFEDTTSQSDAHQTVEDTVPEYLRFSTLSHIAMIVRRNVASSTHVKGGIPYPASFTGREFVSAIQSHLELNPFGHGRTLKGRKAALAVAHSLQSESVFYEVEWNAAPLLDTFDDLYVFLDDTGGLDLSSKMDSLPTSVITTLTRCYSPSCVDSDPCYAYSCPRRKKLTSVSRLVVTKSRRVPQRTESQKSTFADRELRRQKIIEKVIAQEQEYIKTLDLVESIFIRQLQKTNPPAVQMKDMDYFIIKVFGNILDLRECSRRFLNAFTDREQELNGQGYNTGDIFLNAVNWFHSFYPAYITHVPIAEQVLKDETEKNAGLRLFLEQCSRLPENTHKFELKHFLNRPSQHIEKYLVLIEAIQKETSEDSPDLDLLNEAILAFRNFRAMLQVMAFQSTVGKGAFEKLEWFDIVSKDTRASIAKDAAKRQAIIFELIKGEMGYVNDLENIEIIYVRPLRTAVPPIISPDMLGSFINDVFHNFAELHSQHKKLLEKLHTIQREEHPLIHSIADTMYDAVFQFRDAYLEYIQNYPIGAHRIEDEMSKNPRFKGFVEECVRHRDAHRLDMKSFINRPIPRLLRYELLLKSIMKEAPEGHEDLDKIPAVLDLIKKLGKDSEPGVVVAKQRVEIMRLGSSIVFKTGDVIDMDLLDKNRILLHSSKAFRQPDTGFEWNGWTELSVFLFDHCLIITKPKVEKDGVTRYQIYRRPIPLDLLVVAAFSDPPVSRGRMNFSVRSAESGNPDPASSPETISDGRSVYPCTFHHNARLGGLVTFYTETSQMRLEWKEKIEEALERRKVIQDSNRVFRLDTLSIHSFPVPTAQPKAANPTWNSENAFTGKVTCSFPFTTPKGRQLVAMGCDEGVWIGHRYDSKSMRRVLHLKSVTHCAVLEEFGIFLVLADKTLFAYHIEALVPSQAGPSISQTPQRLSAQKDVVFFTTGQFKGVTLVIYMNKKRNDSMFHALEPVLENINEVTKQIPSRTTRFVLGSQKSDWFRVHKEFFIPSESHNLFFMKATIAIICNKGIELMDLQNNRILNLPRREDPRYEKVAKRCESSQPMGIFRSKQDEFLLCYNEFGLYINKHGDQQRRTSIVEWEGTAQRVAFYSPYVLLFDSHFIEVRHVETGRLVQIIPGEDTRCVWDGRGTTSTTTIHGVRNTKFSGPGLLEGTLMQHVFELEPINAMSPLAEIYTPTSTE